MTITEILKQERNEQRFTRPRMAHMTLFARDGQLRYLRNSGGYPRVLVYTMDIGDILATDWHFVTVFPIGGHTHP